MDENFDQFPTNIAETSGQLVREAFQFDYKRFEVWQGGKCIQSGESKSNIKTAISNGNLIVEINDENVNEYIIKRFSFGEISTNGNRVMWSKDIFNNSRTSEYNNPDISSLFYKQGKLVKVTYTIHNPNTLIEFYIDENSTNTSIPNDNELDILSKKIVELYDQQLFDDSRQKLIQLFSKVRRSPETLKDVNDFESLGRAFLFMLDQNITDDIDNLQMISSLAYLFISKAHKEEPTNTNLIIFRLLLFKIALAPLKYTVMSILEGRGTNIFFSPLSNMNDFKARDAIYQMEVADLEENPIIYMRIEMFNNRKVELDQMIKEEFFLPLKSKQDILIAGAKYHQKLYDYLENKVLVEFDIDF
jgi:hypothetical protein